MTLRLYFDEDTMDADLVHALRIRGIEVTTALEQKMIRHDDTEHLELATSQGRALYSFDERSNCVLKRVVNKPSSNRSPPPSW